MLMVVVVVVVVVVVFQGSEEREGGLDTEDKGEKKEVWHY